MITKTKNSVTAETKALDRFAEMMIRKIESVNKDWQKPWFCKTATGMPRNLSGRFYNGMNTLMLMMYCEEKGYEYPVFATFDHITKLNENKKAITDKDVKDLPSVHVNKGEKSFPVFITIYKCYNRNTKEYVKYDDYRTLSEDERANYDIYPRLQVYNVFNVAAQTNIKEVRPDLYEKYFGSNTETATSEDTFTFKEMDYMIAENKWICPIKPTYGNDAYYSTSQNHIIIPLKSQFKDGESYYGNTLHEMAHSTGSEQYLKRLHPTHFGSHEYAKEELIAELTAALVCQRYGIEKHVKDDSSAYIKNWLDTLRKDASYIKSVLLDVKRASSLINNEIDKITEIIIK